MTNTTSLYSVNYCTIIHNNTQLFYIVFEQASFYRRKLVQVLYKIIIMIKHSRFIEHHMYIMFVYVCGDNET